MLGRQAKLKYNSTQGSLREVNMSTGSKVGALCVRQTGGYNGWAVHQVKPDSIDEYKAAACVAF